MDQLVQQQSMNSKVNETLKAVVVSSYEECTTQKSTMILLSLIKRILTKSFEMFLLDLLMKS